MPHFDPPLLYARCWEDHEPLRQALAIKPGSTVFSIAAAGDNGFALLLDDPERVVMLDRNRTQLALVHLKMACLRHFEPSDTRRLLGAEPASASERRRRFTQIRNHLPDPAAALLASDMDAIEQGLLHLGKFERYLATFRRYVLPLVQWPKTVTDLADAPTLEEQRRIYQERWDTRLLQPL